MEYFQSLEKEIREILPQLIKEPHLHAKWLNTLSYLENCGARKIARSEHPLEVSKEMLKHAAEEFRHAFYLKQQILAKLNLSLPSYHLDALWGGRETLRFLDRLELCICRVLKKQIPSLDLIALKQHAYLLVTYAIELRASELYPIYQELLSIAKSPISVRSILLDEKGHLSEMACELQKLGLDASLIAEVCRIEAKLCRTWFNALSC